MYEVLMTDWFDREREREREGERSFPSMFQA